MSEPGISVFNLSPSEKLQLVEDLWDDLASTPEDVPMHDWQKEDARTSEGKSDAESRNTADLGRGSTEGP